MNQSLEKIDWKTLCPWLLVVDCLRIAFRVRVLLLAFAAMLLILGMLAIVERIVTEALWDAPGISLKLIPPSGPENDVTNIGRRAADGLLTPWRYFTLPVANTLAGPEGFAEALAVFFILIWQVAVWSMFGGAVCRIAALALTRGEAPDVPHSLRFAKRNFWAISGAPLMTFAAVLLASFPVVVMGFLMRVDWLSYVPAILWPLVLLFGLGIALLAIGLLLGFPFMWAAVVVEETDAFDAISRAYAYVYQRPLRLLWYIVVAAFFGWLGGMAVEFVLHATRSMTVGTIRWGLGSDEIPTGAQHVVAFWTAGLGVVRSAYYYAYFWSSAVGIYLLLRRDIDSVQLDEVSIEATEDYKPSKLVASSTMAEAQPASS